MNKFVLESSCYSLSIFLIAFFNILIRKQSIVPHWVSRVLLKWVFEVKLPELPPRWKSRHMATVLMTLTPKHPQVWPSRDSRNRIMFQWDRVQFVWSCRSKVTTKNEQKKLNGCANSAEFLWTGLENVNILHLPTKHLQKLLFVISPGSSQLDIFLHHTMPQIAVLGRLHPLPAHSTTMSGKKTILSKITRLSTMPNQIKS